MNREKIAQRWNRHWSTRFVMAFSVAPWPAQLVTIVALLATTLTMSAAGSGWVIAVGDSTPYWLFRPVRRSWQTLAPVESSDWLRLTLTHPYLDRPTRVVKRVACASGQHLVATGYVDTCDGRVIARPKAETLDGRPLVPFVWDGPVPAGRAFVANPHPDSFDSRYIGFVDLDEARPMVPVW